MKAVKVKVIKDVYSHSLKWLEVSVLLVSSWRSYLVMVSKCIKQRITICAPIGSQCNELHIRSFVSLTVAVALEINLLNNCIIYSPFRGTQITIFLTCCSFEVFPPKMSLQFNSFKLCHFAFEHELSFNIKQ